MNKAVFLDRDGTINVDKHYLYRIEDFEFLPGVIKGLKLLQKDGYLLVIITNQSGIARGIYTEQAFQKLNNWMCSELAQEGIIIQDVFFCPHLENASIERYRAACNCRKPQIGLFVKAIEKYSIDINRSYAIGDKIRDCSICTATNCKGYLIGENESPQMIQQVKNGYYRNIQYVKDLYSAALSIHEHS